MSYIKCGACGYEREKGLNEKGEWDEYLRGKKDFLFLKPDLNFTASEPDGFYDESSVKLVACPQCSTVRIIDSFDW